MNENRILLSSHTRTVVLECYKDDCVLSACVLSRNNGVTPILRYTIEIWAKFHASYFAALRLREVARVEECALEWTRSVAQELIPIHRPLSRRG